jgi:putative ABC transport system permease protein
MILLGLSAGLTAAMVLSRLFSSMIFAISPADPVTYVGVATVLLTVKAVAVYVPARRAGLIDPVQLLRE